MGEDAYLLSEVWSSVRALIWGTYKSMIVYLRKHQLSFSEMDVKSRGYNYRREWNVVLIDIH